MAPAATGRNISLTLVAVGLSIYVLVILKRYRNLATEMSPHIFHPNLLGRAVFSDLLDMGGSLDPW